MTSRFTLLLVLACLVVGGCARAIVWQERNGTESAALIPTCWSCEQVAEYETQECIHCGVDYRWVGRPGEEQR